MMEQETMLKEILKVLKEHGEKNDQRFKEVDENFKEVNRKLDQLNKKQDGTRVELSEIQETTDFLMSKVVTHEKKLRNIT